MRMNYLVSSFDFQKTEKNTKKKKKAGYLYH